MPKRKLAALEKVEADLPNLQHKIKKDPTSYQKDFENQYRQYETYIELVRQAPASAPSNSIISLRDLVEFVSHVADCYPTQTSNFPNDLATLLKDQHEELEHELRIKIVGSIMLLRKKEVVDSSFVLSHLFPVLIATPSKSLRTLVYQKIISDLRASNSKTSNHKLNRTIQTLLYNLLTSDRSNPKAIWAVRITRELWRRQIWTDSKAVEIMKEAALADNVKVTIGGVNFFLGGDKEREEAAEESSDEETLDMGKLKHQVGINKKSRKRERDLKAAAATVRRKERKKNKPHPLNFSALHLLHDPQSFAETLFQRHLSSSKSKLNLDQKLIVLQLVSRLVGLHKLTIMNLYSYFIKYLTPRQTSVTSFLASLAQSSHNLVPPDMLEPLVQKIANEFVSEAAATQVAAAGLNAIREICARQPLAMNDTLLQDLIMYRKSKDKGVMMAARGLLSLYREVGAEMLKRRDRGKDAVIGLSTGTMKQQRYGEEVVGQIEGLELLEKWKEEQKAKKREGAGLAPKGSQDLVSGEDGEDDDEDENEDDWNAWDVEDNDSDDSGGWIDVESDGDPIDVSDSDEEKPLAKKPKAVVEESKDGDVAQKSETDKKESISNLATTRILTPADLAKLNELRLQASVNSQLPANKRRAQLQAKIQRHADDPLTAAEIEAASSLGIKSSKAEKVALAKADRDENHQSATAKRKELKREAGKSSTNKEKARRKNFLMTLGKARGKQKRSLREVGKVLKNHIDRKKRGGRRGNQGND